MSRPAYLPCPRCAAKVRIRVEGPRVIWTPAACPERCSTYHGTETWTVTDPTFAEESTPIEVFDARD